ncbi:hypothetical protein GALL_290070 [mine drainage metagenome]|uniref:Uncharacterized protein n=1 Tax=mine drainage metagenome TaxID=410659 RepID=A0A1J5QZF2_9ZZZZ
MKLIRTLVFFLALGAGAAAFAADPTGIWKWTTRLPNGQMETTLKLEWRDGKLAGAYSNQFGDASISNVSFHDDLIAFDVVRDLGGTAYVVKYHGKLEDNTIKGTIEAPGHDGGADLKLDWNAKRVQSIKAGGATPKA